ncbi:MAG: tryptophan synthase subunit alpha [Syntrophomonas sp.]|uniref:tryptophan synthase subunit alpha n=1 Tax=Syntrophomonas sp. TaxID=2053627 RepID=UPI00263131D9|nr:tryptophan synthase subunit alpha [Syntrophomonas sp.]MDD2510089.1 tryptophan synthase subunit alpha [Syntrophomonas sp.]MDD3878722.1 tryptophan synthase subunit alpha [Syntrophomonas sp.]MDD4627072.1 tryptophan synthase subunit alpha [Syntrophomonas sp.]
MEIRNRLAHLREKEEMALIAFIMAAVPDEDLCLDCIRALEQGGCDLLELGVPFTDPLADGEVIERFHHRGVKLGLNLKRGLDFAARVRAACQLPLILFSYYNPILQMGLDSFARDCREAGVNGVIVPDLPLDELGRLAGQGLELIPMLAPSSTLPRVQMAADLDPAFIYCVSVRGVTGVRSLPELEIKDYLQKVRAVTTAPLVLGFGISQPEQVRAFQGLADGVVIGSALAQIIEEYESRPALLPGMLEKRCQALKLLSYWEVRS